MEKYFHIILMFIAFYFFCIKKDCRAVNALQSLMLLQTVRTNNEFSPIYFAVFG